MFGLQCPANRYLSLAYCGVAITSWMNLQSLSGLAEMHGAASPSPPEAMEVVEVVIICSGVVVADSSSISQVSTPEINKTKATVLALSVARLKL